LHSNSKELTTILLTEDMMMPPHTEEMLATSHASVISKTWTKTTIATSPSARPKTLVASLKSVIWAILTTA